jgi:hypothetical protein
MLISHRKGFIYLKTMKTAGTAVEAYFEPYCLPEGPYLFQQQREACESAAGVVGWRGIMPTPLPRWYNHMSADLIQQQVGDEVWTGYFKFCAVRNPFAKLVSVFHFFAMPRQQCGALPLAMIQQEFRKWLKAGNWIIDRDKYVMAGRVCVDYFIRFEQLPEGIREVCARLQIPYEPERILHLRAACAPICPGRITTTRKRRRWWRKYMSSKLRSSVIAAPE